MGGGQRAFALIVFSFIFINLVSATTVISDNSVNSTSFNLSGNLTLGQKITFALGEVIDNIVNGWIRVVGGLNVTGDVEIQGNLTAKTGRTATFVVAANDSSATSKAQADYVCDGVADNVEIQEAIDALPSGGGRIHLLEGTYTITSGITISSNNVILSGSGDATHVTASGTAGSIGTGILVTGDHVTIRDFFFDGNTNVISYQIIITNNQYSRVEDMTICCSRTDGIVFGPNTTDGIATNNFLYNHYNPDNIDDHTSSLEIEDGAERIIITNNKVYNSNSGFFPHVHSGYNTLRNIEFSNNILINGPNASDLSGTGIYINNEGSAELEGMIIANNIIDGGILKTTGAMNLLVDGNVFENATGIAPSIHITISAEGSIIVNNIIRDGGQYGIQSFAPHTLISNNQIYNNGHNGIRLEETADYSSIIGNIIKNNGVTGYSYGIDLQGTDYVLIKGNQIFDDAGTQENGIRIRSGSTNTLVLGNIIVNHTANQIWNDATDPIIENNIGYITEISSTAIISSGNTYTDVTHGLAITPSINDISITPTNNLSNANLFWISEPINSTSFRINVDQDPSGYANFTWQINSY